MSFDEKWDTDLYAGKHGNTEQFGNELLHLTDIHSTKTDKMWIRRLAYFFYCLLALWFFLFFFLSFFFSFLC